MMKVGKYIVFALDAFILKIFNSDLFTLSPALLTLLMLCERLFLDHAHRFNSSKAK